eukprot:TRINITY_DN14036_c0_g1_i1.p2 TRINITY_DN14036_c0_g1~~TRINITY_DN14036_c0_g1_i1.p2  ORF type:complete len:58 (+),score=8.25 TRINITY_DN14036_c0_g1_i1:327-500(+)
MGHYVFPLVIAVHLTVTCSSHAKNVKKMGHFALLIIIVVQATVGGLRVKLKYSFVDV